MLLCTKYLMTLHFIHLLKETKPSAVHEQTQIYDTFPLFCSKEMRKYSFNHMLLALALFDLLFVVCAVPTHALPALGLKHNWARGIKQNRQA